MRTDEQKSHDKALDRYIQQAKKIIEGVESAKSG